MNGIIGKNWKPGSYDRRNFAGDLMQYKYVHRGFRIARSEFAALFEDEECARLAAAGKIPAEQYRAYILEGCRYFFVCPELLEGTNEDVFRSALSLRTKYFGTELFMKAYEKKGEPHRIDGIRQWKIWDRFEDRPVRILYLSEPEFAPDFEETVKTSLRAGKKLYVLAAAEEDGALPTERTLRGILGTTVDQAVILKARDLHGSMDFSRFEIPEELQDAILHGKTVLLGYGEDALMSARNLWVPAFITVRPKGLYTRAVTGLFSLDRTSFIYVPEEFDIFPYVPVIRRTELHYNLLAALAGKYGEEFYAMLQPETAGEGPYSGPRAYSDVSGSRAKALERLRKWEPEMFFNIYEDHVPPVSARGFCWTEGGFEKAREQFLQKKLNALPGIRPLHACFQKRDPASKGRLLDPEPREIDWEVSEPQHQVVVDGVVIDPALPIRFQIEGTETVSPREALFGHHADGRAILSNFAFFFTEKLRTLYNMQRMDRPAEMLQTAAGYVDYFRYTDAEGKRHESFPLYRKLCLGRKPDGRFSVFSFELCGGTVVLSDMPVRFSKEDVNPSVPGDTAVYTPLISEGEEGDILGYRKVVGEGRLNLIFIGEKLTAVIRGGVLMPPVGVVLSLTGELAKAVGSLLEKTPLKELPVSIHLVPPEGFAVEEWEDLQEIYGGGLGLLYEGREMTEENSLALLGEQGWTCPLSAQSQESDLIRRMKHPRTATGVTEDSRLVILVFSGRSNVSEGADYLEMLEAARLLVPDLKALINWDGGGSSVLGLIEGEASTETNPCAPSDDSLAGMARPISSSILVEIPPAQLTH